MVYWMENISHQITFNLHFGFLSWTFWKRLTEYNTIGSYRSATSAFVDLIDGQKTGNILQFLTWWLVFLTNGQGIRNNQCGFLKTFLCVRVFSLQAHRNLEREKESPPSLKFYSFSSEDSICIHRTMDFFKLKIDSRGIKNNQLLLRRIKAHKTVQSSTKLYVRQRFLDSWGKFPLLLEYLKP